MRITRRAAVTGLAAGALVRPARAASALKVAWNGWPESQVKPLFDAFQAANPDISAPYELIPFAQLFQQGAAQPPSLGGGKTDPLGGQDHGVFGPPQSIGG